MSDEYTYKYLDGCNNTPVVPIYFQAMAELTIAGHNHKCVSFNYDQKAIVALDGPVIVGLMLIEDCKWKNSLMVVLGYVVPTYRRKGIYTELWNRAVEKAQELERVLIEGATYIDNRVMQAVMDKHGRKAVSINYEYQVPKYKIR